MLIGLGLGLFGNRASSGSSFDPASLDYTLWCRGSYGGVPWVGVASAGTSGSRNLDVGTAPAVGAAVDGFTPAEFNGTTHELRVPAPEVASDVITTTVYTVELVIMPTDQPASSGFPFNQPGIVTEGGGNWGIYRELNTIRVMHGSAEVASATVPEDVWSHVVIRFGLVAGELDIFVDGALADHNTGVAATGAIGGVFFVGTNFGATVNFVGEIMEVKGSKVAFSDVNVANLYAAAQARYPSMGL